MAMTDIDWVGIPNKRWGVCGFTSALYALHKIRGEQFVRSVKDADEMESRMMSEIKIFFQICRLENKTDIIKGIEEFSTSLGFRRFNVKLYLSNINNFDKVKSQRWDVNFGLAMTPKAVVEYLKYAGLRGSRVANVAGEERGMRIAGVAVDNVLSGPYHGLQHWVFVDDQGTVYSWGLQFPSLKAAAENEGHKDYTEVVTILPAG